MTEAKRDNQGKLKLSLVPSALMKACARSMMYGEIKYGLHNWRNGGDNMSYHSLIDSLLRHVTALIDGEDFDDESGLHQIDHIAANVAFLAEYIENGNIVDDRFKRNTTVRLFADESTKFLLTPGTPDASNPCLERRLEEEKKKLDEERIKRYNKCKLPTKDYTDGQ